jgi:pimeloyl-ACP methyl ester carboxylesterase
VVNFVLVPGAGGSGWYWQRITAALTERGHRATAVELPGSDPDAGLVEYRDIIVAAAREMRGELVLVAQSLGGFSAPLACDQLDVACIVLVNAMIPEPGETAGEWWDHVGWDAAAQASAVRDGRPPADVGDLETVFFHDLPPDIAAVMRADPHAAAEGPAIFDQRWPLDSWPDVCTRVLAGRDDRFFPVELQRRVARERLELDVEVLPGGHLLALSQPAALADRLSAALE